MKKIIVKKSDPNYKSLVGLQEARSAAGLVVTRGGFDLRHAENRLSAFLADQYPDFVPKGEGATAGHGKIILTEDGIELSYWQGFRPVE